MIFNKLVRLLLLGLSLPLVVSAADRAETKVLKKAMSILVVADRFPFFTKKPIQNIVIELRKKGHNIKLFAKKIMPMSNADADFMKYQLQDILLTSLPHNLNEYDIIFCQYGHLGKMIAETQLGRNAQCKLVTCFRGGDITRRAEATNAHYKELFDKGNLFFPVCGYFKYLLETIGCPPEKIKVVPSPINMSEFPFKKRFINKRGPLHIVSICRLTSKKGIDYMLKAVARVASDFPNIRYSIIGDGPDKAALQELAKSLGIASKVTFHGWQDHDQIRSIFDTVDIFMLASITTPAGLQEGIPNALREAICAGIPTIATYHSGNVEVIDHHINGLLVPERDIISLVNSIKFYINNPQKAQQYALNAYNKLLKQVSREVVGNQIEELFLNLLNR